MCVCVYARMRAHTQRERERERERDKNRKEGGLKRQNETNSMHHVCCVKNDQQKSSMAENSVNQKHSDHHYDANTVFCPSSCREVSQHFELCTEHSVPHSEQ